MTRKQALMTVVIAAFVLAANRPAMQSTWGSYFSQPGSFSGSWER